MITDNADDAAIGASARANIENIIADNNWISKINDIHSQLMTPTEEEIKPELTTEEILKGGME